MNQIFAVDSSFKKLNNISDIFFLPLVKKRVLSEVTKSSISLINPSLLDLLELTGFANVVSVLALSHLGKIHPPNFNNN
jgi:hypothetical protein